MKKVMFTNVILLSAILLTSFATPNTVSDSKDILGTWNYSVPDAPVQYQEGQLIIEEKDGKLSGYTMVGSFKNEIRKPKIVDNILTFSMYIEGTDVSFNLRFNKDKFTGTVVYYEGTLNITGVKKSKD